MQTTTLDDQIQAEMRRLSGEQKSEVLDFIQHFQKNRHSQKLYRSKALKQIRAALSTHF